MHGNFTWIDLSTFDVSEAKSFYHSVFQWDFPTGNVDYVNCSKSDIPCAGLYEMPDFFQKIKMPSFWMTYISVSDIERTITKARELGGQIEIEETNALGRVALIRDPAGAGFTCYEGKAQSAIAENTLYGRWYWSELFVSDLSKVDNFYAELFGWSFEEEDRHSTRYSILNEKSKRIGAVQVTTNEIKGNKEFWGVFFKGEDLKKELSILDDIGGKIIFEHQNSDGIHYLVNDSQGAAFFITFQEQPSHEVVAPPPYKKGSLKWRSFIGLITVYLAVFMESNWLWGALFLFWVIPDLKSGTTFFIEPLNRRQNPFLYWAVMTTWILSSIYLLINHE